MKIDTVRIQGYRSLANLVLRPGAFTVLVGPNNSGKSNIVDAMDFLADVYRSGARLAIDRKGGFENISFRRSGVPVREISFEVVATAHHEELRELVPSALYGRDRQEIGFDHSSVIKFRHSFTLRGEGGELISDYSIQKEEVVISQEGYPSKRLLTVDRKEKKATIDITSDSDSLRLLMPFLSHERVDLLEDLVGEAASPRDFTIVRLALFVPSLSEFTGLLAKTRTYQLVPPECRVPASPTPVADLDAHGSNLPALIYHLKAQSPKSWASVMQNMSLIVPDLEQIDIKPTPDRLWTLQFTESGIGRQWNASEVSDGTIRALALFSAVYDPRSMLLAIEEPENSVHPWILRVFVGACREVSSGNDGKQVIVTTHSPVLIDHLDPAEIVVVWRQEGRTMLRSLPELDPEVRSTWESGEATLFDLLDSGILRQAVPSLL